MICCGHLSRCSRLVVSAALPASVPGGSIEDFIDREMPASGVPGLAYAVVADGEITTGARGVVRLGGDRKVTPDTPFLTGSISKSFTALAVDATGRGGQDRPGRRSLALSRRLLGPARRRHHGPAAAQPHERLLHTARERLAHGHHRREGRACAAGRPAGRGHSRPTQPERDGGSTRTRTTRSLVAWSRSSAGRITRPMSQTNILEPVGMEHSFVADGEVHESMATGHRPWFGTKRPLPENRTHRGTAPQGGIVASAKRSGALPADDDEWPRTMC